MWTPDFWLETLRRPESFWSMLTTVTTIVLAWVAYRQLSDLARTGKSDFLYKLKKDFFTAEVRQLVFLMENDFLEFRSGDIPYFAIVPGKDLEAQSRMKELAISETTVSTYVVDDLLLGPLEDVGILLKRNMLSLEEVYEQFESYVQLCADNHAVGAYLKLSRSGEDNEDVYDGLEYLRLKLQGEGPTIRERKVKKK